MKFSSGQAANGDLDENDETAMEIACKQAVLDAKTHYDACIEYLS